MKPKDTTKSKIPTCMTSGGQRTITDLMESANLGKKESVEGTKPTDKAGEGEEGEGQNKVTFTDPPKEPDASSLGTEEGLIGTRSPSGVIITNKTPIIPTEPRTSTAEIPDGASATIQDV